VPAPLVEHLLRESRLVGLEADVSQRVTLGARAPPGEKPHDECE
jgi:hypothetical protein